MLGRPLFSLPARLPLMLSALFLTGHVFAQSPLPSPSVQGIATEAQVVVLTKVPAPWYAPKGLIVNKFRDSIPEYEATPGLQYKYYTLTDDKRFGGLYFWTTRVQAQAWFNEAWFARVQKERGAEGEAIYFDSPVVLDNSKPGEPPPGADGKAVASVVTIALRLAQAAMRLLPSSTRHCPITLASLAWHGNTSS
jgi:hypothetical protein